jgi:hypothetical protein
VWLFYKRDLGAVPNWDALCADWDAMIQEIRAEDGHEEDEDEEPAAAE